MSTVKHFSILSFLLFFIFPTNVVSQDKEEELNLGGKFALQFQIAENFQFTSFSGTTFSGKYHLNNCSALRLSLSLSVSNSEGGANSILSDSIFDNDTYSDYTTDLTTFRVDVQYLHNISITKEVIFYLGGGAFIGTYVNNNELSYNSSPVGTVVKREITSSTLGIGLITGVEWFVKDNISLLGEYSSELAYRKHKSELEELTTVTRYDNEETTSWSFSANTVKLGVSVYF